MWNACRTALAVITVLVTCSPRVSAQTYPNGLTMDSARPDLDSIFLAQIRTEMDKVREREQRPTVGLVLSGGGAKGAAQVGALMYLEELGVPVDLVCGTSIGGLLGGLYAVGYNASELRELFQNQDWNRLLTDAVDQKYIPYATKMYNAKYLLTVPFRNALDILVRAGKDSHELSEEYRKQSLASSLPSGYAFGFNVNNQISSLTVGYQDSLSFRDLPIPFVCVASDMISCKAKNFGCGSLNTAMRSTMSIPGLFDPVRTEGMVLVDGGTRNNFPADVARAMGADIVIGIELSDLMPGFDEVNNIADILSQMISMLGTDAYNKNKGMPDVFIKPRLDEFNMLSFNSEAVDTMIARGYEAAKARTEDILNVKSRLGEAGQNYRSPKATDISKQPVRIASIEFEGISDKESQMLSRMLTFKAGDLVDKAMMDEVMSRFQATGDFASLTYSLLGSEEPYRLVFDCVTAPANSVGLGFRIDSEEWASLLLNLGINTNSLMGSRANLTAKLGQNIKFNAHYSLDLAELPTINFEASIARYSGNLATSSDRFKYGVSYWTHKELLYLTDVRLTKVNFKTGFKNQYNNVDPNTFLGSIIAEESSRDMLVGNYVGIFAQGEYYTFDDYYYPSKGVNMRVSANYDFAKTNAAGFEPVLMLGLDWKHVFRISDAVALIPDVHLRNIFTSAERLGSDGHIYKDISILHTNMVGGTIDKRYTEGQVPFFGINNLVPCDEHMAVASLELRVNPFNKLYFSALAGLVESNDTFSEMFSGFTPDFYAFGLQAGYNTPLGPLKFDLHWNQVHKFGVYFSFGYDF